MYRASPGNDRLELMSKQWTDVTEWTLNYHDDQFVTPSVLQSQGRARHGLGPCNLANGAAYRKNAACNTTLYPLYL